MVNGNIILLLLICQNVDVVDSEPKTVSGDEEKGYIGSNFPGICSKLKTLKKKCYLPLIVSSLRPWTDYFLEKLLE